MNHLFYGDDKFSIREATVSLKEQAGEVDIGDVNVATFAAANLSLDELLATCNTVPFLSDKRVVIVDGLLTRFEHRSGLKGASGFDSPPGLGEWEKLGSQLSNVPNSTDLVFVDGNLGKNNPLLSRIKSKVTVRIFSVPRGRQLRDWLSRRAASKGMDIELSAVNLLAETVGGDLDTLDSELEKLALYRNGASVRDQDVKVLVSYTKEASIFATVDAMIEGRIGVSIRLIQQLLESGRPSTYLLTMMARQIRLLLLVKDLKERGIPVSEFGDRLSLSEYPLRKTLEQEFRFTLSQLSDIHHMILETDISMKSSSIDETIALELLVAGIASKLGNGSALSPLTRA